YLDSYYYYPYYPSTVYYYLTAADGGATGSGSMGVTSGETNAPDASTSAVPELLAKARLGADTVNAGVAEAMNPVVLLVKTRPNRSGDTLTYGPIRSGSASYVFTVKKLSNSNKSFSWELRAKQQSSGEDLKTVAGGTIDVSNDSPPVTRSTLGVDGDALVLICGCEKLPPAMLARMVASGTAAGLSVVATTTSATAAAGLAGSFGALVVHRLAAVDAHLGGAAIQPAATAGGAGAVSAAGILAARIGTRMVPVTVAAAQSQASQSQPSPFQASPSQTGGALARNSQAGMLDLVPQPRVPVATLLSLRTAQFVLAVTAPRPRLAELGVREPSRSGRA
ncbi:MAG TPA: hypothetical protein VHF26_17820, partial [Trebonia sp.]|nr:hypothetical protein [Trebonia sp.]